MIRIIKPLKLNTSYDLSRIGDPEKLLFFDIETTGLSAFDASVYLIGCLCVRNGQAEFRQWLTESLGDELPMLREFFEFAENFDTLIHFNGDTFDIPFLNAAALQYTCASPLPDMKSFDILKHVRKYRKFFDLPNMKLKSIERFLGIEREDKYSGGELIDVYKKFQSEYDEDLKDLLLLHNEEDVLGLPALLPVLNYSDFLTLPSESISVTESYLNRPGNRLFVTITSEGFYFTKNLHYIFENDICVSFENSHCLIELPVYNGTLKYYYPNYKDYYFLPKENCAIHKKLAQYVDKNYREPATKENCCCSIDGMFLPSVKGLDLPAFRDNYHAVDSYCKYENDTFLKQYITALFALI